MPTQLTLPYDAPQAGDAWRHRSVPDAFMVCVCPEGDQWLYKSKNLTDNRWRWASWRWDVTLRSKKWEPISLEEVEV